MLTVEDLGSLRGTTIVDVEVRTAEGGGQVLRLRRSDGAIVGLQARADELELSDETSIPWGA